jgi:hypothetical protein
MPLTAEEQRELDQLELQELEAEETGNPGESPPSGNAGSSVGEAIKGLIGAVTSARGGLLKGASMGYLDPAKLGGPDVFRSAMKENPGAAAAGQVGGAFAPGAAFGAGTAALTPLMGTGLKGLVGRAGLNAIGGGLQGLIGKPEEGGSRIDNALTGMKVGAGASVGMDAAAKGAELVGRGGRGLADWLMKGATGIRRAPEGVGNTLVDEGLLGSAAHMEDRARSKLPLAELDVQQAVKSIPQKTPSSTISSSISRMGDKYINPDTGMPFPGKEPYLQQVRDSASKVADMGELSADGLLKLKRASDWVARNNSGNVGASLDAEVNAAQADAARGALDNLSDGATAEALKREQALLYAKQALEKDPTTHTSLFGRTMFGKIPGASIVGSGAAQAIQKGVANPSRDLSQVLKDPKLIQTLSGLLGK